MLHYDHLKPLTRLDERQLTERGGTEARSHNEPFFLREPAVQLVALKDVAEQA